RVGEQLLKKWWCFRVCALQASHRSANKPLNQIIDVGMKVSVEAVPQQAHFDDFKIRHAGNGIGTKVKTQAVGGVLLQVKKTAVSMIGLDLKVDLISWHDYLSLYLVSGF